MDSKMVPLERIASVLPRVHVKSRSGYTGAEGDVLERLGCSLHLVDGVGGVSSTRFLQRMEEKKKMV